MKQFIDTWFNKFNFKLKAAVKTKPFFSILIMIK